MPAGHVAQVRDPARVGMQGGTSGCFAQSSRNHPRGCGETETEEEEAEVGGWSAWLAPRRRTEPELRAERVPPGEDEEEDDFSGWFSLGKVSMSWMGGRFSSLPTGMSSGAVGGGGGLVGGAIDTVGGYSLGDNTGPSGSSELARRSW